MTFVDNIKYSLFWVVVITKLFFADQTHDHSNKSIVGSEGPAL
jgi:hypothetical protein